VSDVCAAREEEMGKIEIDFRLVVLKTIHLRAEYSGIERRIILKRILEKFLENIQAKMV